MSTVYSKNNAAFLKLPFNTNQDNSNWKDDLNFLASSLANKSQEAFAQKKKKTGSVGLSAQKSKRLLFFYCRSSNSGPNKIV